ncbi:MAG: MFS transporter [Candidatus Thorarchaeota archaeon]
MEVSRRFFGLSDANDSVLRLARIMTILMPIFSLTLMISSTFFMIFVAEAVGGGDFIQGLGIVGGLVVLQMAVSTLLDYPTGALADLVGQRFVLASAFLTYGAAFFLVSIVTSFTPLSLLVVIYALQGFAQSQQSGTLATWFDNNYRAAVSADSDRKQYGVFQARMGMIFQIIATISLIPGAVLATILGRPWVFQLQGILCVIIALVVLRVVQDLPQVKEEKQTQDRPRISAGEYVGLLKGGVTYLLEEPWVKNVIIGSMLVTSTVMVWGNLILFPMYFSYLLTDVAVSSYRTILFTPGVVAQERSGIWSRRFDPKKWIPRFRILQAGGFVFYIIFATIMFFFPPPTVSGPGIDLIIPFTSTVFMTIPITSVIPIILIALTFTFTMISAACADILTQREMLDVIPNNIRNSMYSLQPTIAMIFAMPQIAIFGWLIPIIGFPATLVSIGLISVVGVLIIRKGLHQDKPAERAAASPEPSLEEIDSSFTEEETSVEIVVE